MEGEHCHREVNVDKGKLSLLIKHDDTLVSVGNTVIYLWSIFLFVFLIPDLTSSWLLILLRTRKRNTQAMWFSKILFLSSSSSFILFYADTRFRTRGLEDFYTTIIGILLQNFTRIIPFQITHLLAVCAPTFETDPQSPVGKHLFLPPPFCTRTVYKMAASAEPRSGSGDAGSVTLRFIIKFGSQLSC